jgi:glycosyltransferase involved in cell wall biosynthesis
MTNGARCSVESLGSSTEVPNPAAGGTPEHRRILLVACNDPTAASGLGIRLRTTIDGLAEVGTVDVVAFGGSPSSQAPPEISDFLSGHVNHYQVGRRQQITPTIGGYLRWICRRDVPHQLHFADYDTERATLHDLDNYDLVWCASPRAFLVVGGLAGPLVTDLSQFEAERDVNLLRNAPRGGSAGSRFRYSARLLLARLDRRAWLRLYRRIVRDSVVATICSDLDRDRAGAPTIVVVPNAYPDPGLVHRAQSERTPTILFAGYFPYEPNAAAAELLAREIFPIVRSAVPAAQLRLVGSPTASIEHLGELPGVSVAGFVPAIGDELRGASVVAAPLQVVAGTNVKIIEAFAYGVPVVATTAAAQGLGVQNGREIEIHDDVAGFAAACVSLLTDAKLREQLATRARHHYETQFRAEAVRELVAQVVRQVLAP